MRRMITRARARAILLAWKWERHWKSRHRRRWLRHYAQAIRWHSGYDPRIAEQMARLALLDDPTNRHRDPVTVALLDLGLREEALI